MTANHPNWDDDHWAEGTDKSAWARGCRWLQSWWRETQLHKPPGPFEPARPGKSPRRTKPVTSTLPLEVEWDVNFFTETAARTAERLPATHAGGLVNEDRLRRNLLASQPACINLFAPLERHPESLRAWLLDAVPSLPDDLQVESLDFEWAPPPDEHFGGGSAFDAFITYTAGTHRGFVGVETKYAEHLPSQAPKRIRKPYIDYTRSRPWWRSGASERLMDPATRQFWLNTLLAQSLLERGTDGFDEGICLVVSCAADRAALDATVAVAAELEDDMNELAAVGLHWSPYEDILSATTSVAELGDWRETFRRRYLDFAPVAHKLPDGDPRLSQHDPTSSAYGQLSHRFELARAIAERVTGDGSVAEHVVNSTPGKASTVDVLVAARRFEEASDALKSARRRLFLDR